MEDGYTALAEGVSKCGWCLPRGALLVFPFTERAQLSSLRSEIATVSSALRPRTFCLLRRQHSVLQAHEWRRAAQDNLGSRQHKLHTARASCVRETLRYIYPMEVEAVTVDDEGDGECLTGWSTRERERVSNTLRASPWCCVMGCLVWCADLLTPSPSLPPSL